MTVRQTSLGAAALALVAGLVLSPATMKAADTTKGPVTFAKDIAPILQDKCQSCHRPGTVAPMSLITYEEVRPWARSIKQKVTTRMMPPWHIDKTVGIQEFKNDISLSDAQIDTIARWVDAGSPLGNPADLPKPKQFSDTNEWKLAAQFGQPDLVIKAPAYTMDAHTQDKWWKPVVDTGVTEVRWVRAVETRTSTIEGRRILHHAVASLIQDEKLVPEQFRATPAQAGVPDDDDTPAAGGAGGAGLFSEWAIGKIGDVYREDAGKVLVPGSKISWDIHMSQAMNVQDAKPITAEVELGVYFYPKGVVPKHRTVLTNMGASRGRGIDIAPNTVAATQGFTVLSRGPARLENFQPHMHLRGKAMALEAILPNGQRQMISFVNNFQFNWMTTYEYTDDSAPIFPKGTIISVTAWHDNTVGNKNNPDPNQWVGGGDRSVDEMAHAWVNVTYLSEDEYKAEVARRRQLQSKNTQQQQ